MSPFPTKDWNVMSLNGVLKEAFVACGQDKNGALLGSIRIKTPKGELVTLPRGSEVFFPNQTGSNPSSREKRSHNNAIVFVRSDPSQKPAITVRVVPNGAKNCTVDYVKISDGGPGRGPTSELRMHGKRLV